LLSEEPKASNKIDAESLGAIRACNGLPFARRYFKKLPKKPFERTLKELIRQGAVREYEPLVEVSGAYVGWKEHTIYLGPEKSEVLTA
jgi:methionyl aminopeptidase